MIAMGVHRTIPTTASWRSRSRSCSGMKCTSTDTDTSSNVTHARSLSRWRSQDTGADDRRHHRLHVLYIRGAVLRAAGGCRLPQSASLCSKRMTRCWMDGWMDGWQLLYGGHMVLGSVYLTLYHGMLVMLCVSLWRAASESPGHVDASFHLVRESRCSRDASSVPRVTDWHVAGAGRRSTACVRSVPSHCMNQEHEF